MTNTVLIKRSGTANSIPSAGQLLPGELAINYSDGNLFYKNTSNVVTLLTSNQFVSVAGNVTSGNLNATGLSLSGNVLSVINSTSNVTTTGNVSAGYFIGDGSQLTGIIASAGAAITNGTSNVTVAGNSNVTVGITGTTVATFASTGEYVTGLISATGNVTGNYILGNGSQLTGISTSATKIFNGTSEANIGTSDGNANISIGGVSNVAVFTTTGEYITGVLSASGNITGGNLITSAAVSAASVSTSGNVTSGNLNTTGLSLSGNVLSAINSTSNITTNGNITGGNVLTSGQIISTGSGNADTGAGQLYLNGATNNRIDWNTNGTGAPTTTTRSAGTKLLLYPAISGIQTDYAMGIDSATLWSSLPVDSSSFKFKWYGATTEIASLDGTGNLSAAGNITGGNLITSAAVSAASVSASGNITGGNIIGVTDVVVPTVRNTASLTISTSSGNLNLQPTGNVVVNSTYINGVTNPVQNQDVATKIYVDNAVSTAISYHEPVAAATTTTLAAATGGTISYTQPNGAGNGVGALLTTTGSFDLIDTANVQTLGTRILVKNEANAVLNGVYTWANATNIVRSTDTDTYGAGNVSAIGLNDYFFTTGGNVNLGAAFIVSAPTGTITFGTSNIEFAQFSSSQTYTANTAAGISLAGTVINAKVDGTTTAFDGGGNISVKASATLTTPNIGAATGTSLSVTGNVTGGNLNAAGLSLSSNVVSALNVTGNIAGGNITTPGLISVTGNITGGNVLGGANVNATLFTGTTVSVTGNITGGNLLISGAIIDSAQLDIQTSAANANIVLTPNGTGIVGVATSLSVTGNITGGNVLGGANVNATTHTGTTVSVTGAITGAGITGTSLTVSTGTVTLGNIVNANGNGVGNIGSSTTYFDTVFAKATSAQYADLAEMYTADATYAPGTVLIFGGEQEVTANISSHSTAIAGVVSENPSHLMNAGLEGEHVAAVALLGRVSCQVQGTIRKGDLLVASDTAGVAQRLDISQYQPGCVIGKSLANYDSDIVGTIEIAVGIK